jgi:hypothetical protein
MPPASNADGHNIQQWLTEAEIALADSIPSLWDETKALPADLHALDDSS